MHTCSCIFAVWRKMAALCLTRNRRFRRLSSAYWKTFSSLPHRRSSTVSSATSSLWEKRGRYVLAISVMPYTCSSSFCVLSHDALLSTSDGEGPECAVRAAENQPPTGAGADSTVGVGRGAALRSTAQSKLRGWGPRACLQGKDRGLPLIRWCFFPVLHYQTHNFFSISLGLIQNPQKRASVRVQQAAH